MTGSSGFTALPVFLPRAPASRSAGPRASISGVPISALSAVEIEHAGAERLGRAVRGERGVVLARRAGERAHDRRRERSPAQSRAPRARRADSSGVLPPSTMLAMQRHAGCRAPPTMRASSSRGLRRLDEQHVGAGLAVAHRRARSRARSPRPRPRRCARSISVSGERRASSAALILPTISVGRNQRLAVEVAAALGEILVLELDRIGAGALEQRAPCAAR